MQKHNHIKALLFLSIFSMLILHQAFPHLHHQHQGPHSHSDLAHSGEHHHHDDGSKEKDEARDGLFGLFMDMHLHSTVSSDIIILKRNTVEQQTVAVKDVANKPCETQRPLLIDNGQNESPPIYHPPNKYFNPYLSYLDLRGPPALG
ncbi:hypothetical protein [Maribacter sp. ACAM166]|uniref:hypothetical protein n=1 Tax=Maribacter sp. ACAM166 TaxID=2508996 RepID=UPI0010FE2D08|nr:hypothetical protein [Maribacter sp. ACAM166]TLP71219.1 hypothetical protein ES765_19740 [Maribacter sp. ACAM166]